MVEAPVTLVHGTPAQLNAQFAAGQLEVSAISALAYLRQGDDCMLLPDLSIGSESGVNSVLLISREPLEQLEGRPIAVTDEGATTPALLKILLEQRYGIQARYQVAAVQFPETLRDHAAILLIGDAALRALPAARDDYLTWDLGALWRQWTGLPMVYAVWVVRRDVAEQSLDLVERVHGALLASKAWGLSHLEEVAQAAARASGFSVACVAEYFRWIRYDLDGQALSGLRRFAEATQALGVAGLASRATGAVENKAGMVRAANNSPTMGVAGGILERACRGQRLTAEEALCLWEGASLYELGQAADERRRALQPQNLGTFVVDRNINYTNACVADCSFCAFYRLPGHPDAYRLPMEEILRRVGELAALGGTQVLLQGGLDPSLPLEYYEGLCRTIKAHYPQVHIHSFSAPEIDTMAQVSGLSYHQVFERLMAAGLDSMPGGGAEILIERVRQAVSPKKLSAAGWFAVHRAAHEVGLKTTATMTYGMVETVLERIEHLVRLRQLQDETGGFRAFIPWSFQRGRTVLDVPPAGGREYLKVIAMARLLLDNIPNIQAGWVTEGPKLAQLALSFGANDFGGILIDEVVVGATGTVYRVDRDEAIRLIRGAGRIPAQRNTRYEILRVFNDTCADQAA